MKEALLKRVHREFMEVLESINEGRVHHDGDDFHEILRDIEAALAQPEQEPVAWMDIDEKGSASGLRYWSEPDNRHEVALYTKENT